MPCKSVFRLIKTAVFAIAASAGLVGCNRYALDKQMERLCRIHGGIRVYEKITISRAAYKEMQEYSKNPNIGDTHYGPKYRYLSQRQVIVGDDANVDSGVLARSYMALYRRSTDKLLGERVEYIRSGADSFTFGFQPSNRSCPGVSIGLAESIFIIGE